VRALLARRETDLNWRSAAGAAPLAAAAAAGAAEVAELLIGDARFDAVRAGAAEAVAEAAQFASGLARSVLAHCDVNQHFEDRKRRPTTLLRAVLVAGNAPLALEIMAAPAFAPDAASLRAAAFAAVRCGSLAALRAIVAALGGDVNVRTGQRASLLTKACARRNREIVEFIVEAPSFSADESLALDAVAVALETCPDALPVIAGAPGVDVNAVLPRRPVKNKDARDAAAVLDGEQIEDVNALGYALRKSWISTLTTLLAIPSIRPAQRDGRGRTPLFHAIASQWMDIDVFFAFPGMDIDAQDDDGCTALHAAVANQRGEAIVQLVLFGADRTIANKRGETAWMLAHRAADGAQDREEQQPDEPHEYIRKIVATIKRRF
jgi:ankyrin repeat protein